MLKNTVSSRQVILIGLGVLSLCRWALALETVSLGENGSLNWRGEGSSSVETIEPQYRSLFQDDDVPGVELDVGNSPGNLVEFDNDEFPGSIHPLRIPDGENIANTALKRGGGITAPNVFDLGGFAAGIFDAKDLELTLEELIETKDGGELKAFERKNYNALGTLIFIDLGGLFGVNRVRFYPRNTVFPSPTTPFQNDFLRAFELFTNDGSQTEGGNRIWEPLLLEPDNVNPVVDVVMDPPRPVKALRLRATTTVNYEIDEFEVFGTGFLSNAEYISPIFDAGQPAVWNVLRWQEEAIGDPAFSNIQIRTRTGRDTNPLVFTRLLYGQRNPTEISLSVNNPGQEMDLAEYKSLPLDDELGRRWEHGPVREDLVNWSPFSTPFPASAANDTAGSPITSPGPRRYFQFRVLFNSSDLDAGRVLKNLSFDVLAPPLADAVIGEIFPRDVPVSQSTSFTYALRTVAQSEGLLGFDTVEISTAGQVESIDEIEMKDSSGQIIAERAFSGLDDLSTEGGFQIVSVSPASFSVRLPPVQEDNIVILLRFQTGVLTYSTNFTGSVQLSTEPGASQAIISGDAVLLGEGDEADLSGTTVLSPSVLEKTQLLDQIFIEPNIFSPNGDGANDVMGMSYNLLSLSIVRPVAIGIYDLSGRQIRVIHDGPEANGQYTNKTWDGRNEHGQLVPPGLYVVHIRVKGDAKVEEKAHIVGVAY
ncbi:MAG: gliding motility-associated C-terminal domain-containing protein [Gemmatimonadetes bacterium]|nr:gliding motility-associated C-terminal domain-containing protein [Gemmatimonadota bacterium]